jgi:hypothetical protein
MRIEASLLGFSIALFTWPGKSFAYTPSSSFASLDACIDDSCTTGTAAVFSGTAVDTCEFSACTTFTGAGVAHSIHMERPHKYVTLPNGVLQHPLYGNVTCLMYATSNCSGTSQLETIPAGTQTGCGTSSSGWKSFECRFGDHCT